MQKQKIRGMVLAAVVCCVSLSGCGAAEKTAQQTDLPAIIIGSDNYRLIIMRMWTANQRG